MDGKRKRYWNISISLAILLLAGGWLTWGSVSSFLTAHAAENASHCDAGGCGFVDVECASHCISTYIDSTSEASLPTPTYLLAILASFGALSFLLVLDGRQLPLAGSYVHSNRKRILSVMKRE